MQCFRSRTKYSFCPLHQPKTGYFFCVNIFRGYQIDPRGLDAAVTQHVGEGRNVTGSTVKTPGKEMTQIMRKHLFPGDACCPTESFHLRPDLSSIKPPAGLSSGKAPLIRSPFFGHISAASDKAAPGSGSFSVFLLKRSASCPLQRLPE